MTPAPGGPSAETAPPHTALSIVVPVYNEAESVPALVQELAAIAGELPQPAEWVFVDDGSRDNSIAVLQLLAQVHPAIRIIALDRNNGQSAALWAGFQAAQGEWIVTLDADGQNDPADIPRLLALLSRYDTACGVRTQRRDTRAKRWASRWANRARQRLLRDQFRDVGCSLKAFRRRDILRCPWFNGAHRFIPILLEMQGLRVTEIEVHHRARERGISKYGNWDRLLRTWQDVLGVRWLQHRTIPWEGREARNQKPETRI